jgi:hypothetical protein
MDNLENRLWATAVQAAGEEGMEFSVPCSRNVRDLIAAGARDMHRENRISEADVETAGANLARLAREMIRVTREMGPRALSGGKMKIREAALVEAKKLCAVWPYC